MLFHSLCSSILKADVAERITIISVYTFFCNQCVGQRLSPFFFHSPKLCRLTLTRKCAHTHTPMLTDTCLHARTLTPLRGTILARSCHPPTHFSSLSLECVHFTHSQHNTYTSLLQHPFALRHTSAFKHKH